MVLDTLPPLALDPAAAAGPGIWLVRHGESTWNALGLAQPNQHIHSCERSTR